jgi:acetyl esterase/lipase
MFQPTECNDMLRPVAALLPALLVPALLSAAEPKFEVERKKDIAYNSAKDADAVRHKLDFYVPKGAKNYPVMMFVHGGSWKSGNKELYPKLGETFASQGIGVAVINYRLSNGKGTIKHPDHIHDVAKAFAWVKDNADKYGGSKEKLYVSGHSAGGHLVALLATDESYLKAEKCAIKDIRGVMAISGVYTISSLLPMFHDPFSKDAEVCKAASPMTHVKEKHPPFLIAYGTKDFPLMDIMASEFSKKLTECKCDSKLMKVDRDHISIVVEMGTKADDPLGKAMVEFMTKK